MKTNLIPWFLCMSAIAAWSATAKDEKAFNDTFTIDKTELVTTGTNRFFILEPGFQSVLVGKDKGKAMVLTITVLDETKRVDGVETRVVEEKETADGELAEISRNYFALSKTTRDLFYFGEDVDTYKNGKVVDHEGAWLSGVKGARFGLMMPGTPVVGARYQQEVAPKVAMDRAQIISLTETIETPAGRFAQCLKTEETSGLESDKNIKFYAPGVGLISDGTLKLKSYTRRTPPAKPGAPQNVQPSAAANPANREPNSAEPVIPEPLAREALWYVGADPEADEVWVQAINDPKLSAEARQNLIEDLNEDGLSDPQNPGPEDLPLIWSRLDLIEELAPFSMDKVNADAFQEAYKDLVEMVARLTQN